MMSPNWDFTPPHVSHCYENKGRGFSPFDIKSTISLEVCHVSMLHWLRPCLNPVWKLHPGTTVVKMK